MRHAAVLILCFLLSLAAHATESVCKIPADAHDRKAAKGYKKCRKEEARLAKLYDQAGHFGPTSLKIQAPPAAVRSYLVGHFLKMNYGIVSDSAEQLAVSHTETAPDRVKWGLLIGRDTVQSITVNYFIRYEPQKDGTTIAWGDGQVIGHNDYGGVTPPNAGPVVKEELDNLFSLAKKACEQQSASR